MLGKLRRALGRTRQHLSRAVARLVGSPHMDAATRQALEEALIAADVGPATTERLLERLAEGGADEQAVRRLQAAMLEVLRSSAAPFHEPQPGRHPPWVGLLVGVNGSGKTTTAAKLAARYRQRGCGIILGAADTFRAAAVEQLRAWSRRLQVPMVAHRPGGDPAAVVYDTCEAGRARGTEVVLVDTAGRLQTEGNLMAELAKMRRVAGKVIAGAPDEVWLVLDATTGQNGLRQAEQFLEHVGVTGLILAKLDGSARGGVALAIAERFGLPIRYVGVGEELEDLLPFEPEAYVHGLLGIEG